MSTEPTFRMGELVERLHYDAMDAWRCRYAQDLTLADLLAGPLTSIEDQVLSFPGGKLQLVTTLHARRKHESETYFARAQRLGPAEYRLTHSSVNLY